MADIRKRIVFHGRVQGVGFRYTAKYLAQSLGLTGWVTNLWDGRVEMEVQGQTLDIQELLKRIQEQNWIEVSDMEITDIPCEQENSFHIY